jgi:hypothetical protein
MVAVSTAEYASFWYGDYLARIYVGSITHSLDFTDNITAPVDWFRLSFAASV